MPQIDMESEVSEELGEIIVDKDTARASFTAPVDVAKDAILVANEPLTSSRASFEIEILYGSLMTVGLVPSAQPASAAGGDDVGDAVARQRQHPGFTPDSIGYNAETGHIYVASKSLKSVGKSTFGDRVGFSVRTDESSGHLTLIFHKNSHNMYEHELGAGGSMRPAVAMRSSGQVLAVRLLDRDMWGCQTTQQLDTAASADSQALLQLVDRELIECPICRDVFTDPRILPCSIHTFCAACLKTYAASQSGSGHGQGRRSMSCPVCRHTFTLPPGGVTDLPVNSIVTRLLDIRAKFIGGGQGQPESGQGQEAGQGQVAA